MENNSCKDCRAHSGIVESIGYLEEVTRNQQKEINDMKKWLIATLTTSIFSLVGIVVMLAIAYARII